MSVSLDEQDIQVWRRRGSRALLIDHQVHMRGPFTYRVMSELRLGESFRLPRLGIAYVHSANVPVG